MFSGNICVAKVNLTIFYKPIDITLISVSPTLGPTGGGTVVNVTGTGFNQTNAAQWVCRFGNNSDYQLGRLISNDTIQCDSPETDGPGNVSVQISGDGGTYFSDSYVMFLYYQDLTPIGPSDKPPTHHSFSYYVGEYWWWIVVGAAGFFLIVMTIILVYKAGRNHPGVSPSHSVNQSALAPLLAESSMLYGAIREDIDFREIKLAERIGRGNFGEVFVATWRGTIVAVKKTKIPAVVNEKEKEEFLEDFEHEAAIMRSLRHPNVIQFLGICQIGTEICIITEFMPKGSLYRLLHDRTTTFTWDLRLRVALDTSRGMNYLHRSEPIIIHRDLKSHNLLVDENYKVKVSDFGLAKLLSSKENQGSMTACGTPAYTAPEVLRNERYTEKVDVFSFGIVMWELVTREEPHHGVPPFQIVFSVGTQGVRPAIPDSCLLEIRELIEDCWTESPDERPSFENIVQRLETMVKNIYG